MHRTFSQLKQENASVVLDFESLSVINQYCSKMYKLVPQESSDNTDDNWLHLHPPNSGRNIKAKYKSSPSKKYKDYTSNIYFEYFNFCYLFWHANCNSGKTHIFTDRYWIAVSYEGGGSIRSELGFCLEKAARSCEDIISGSNSAVETTPFSFGLYTTMPFFLAGPWPNKISSAMSSISYSMSKEFFLPLLLADAPLLLQWCWYHENCQPELLFCWSSVHKCSLIT